MHVDRKVSCPVTGEFMAAAGEVAAKDLPKMKKPRRSLHALPTINKQPRGWGRVVSEPIRRENSPSLRLGQPALPLLLCRIGQLHGATVDERLSVANLDEDLTEAAVPHVAQHSVCRQWQLRFGLVEQANMDFWRW